jgi:hypothetical protein
MENDKIKNHIRISTAVLVIGYILTSYIFGSFFHDGSNSEDRMFAVIVIVLAAIVSNFIYYENYTGKNKSRFNDNEEIF